MDKYLLLVLLQKLQIQLLNNPFISPSFMYYQLSDLERLQSTDIICSVVTTLSCYAIIGKVG